MKPYHIISYHIQTNLPPLQLCGALGPASANSGVEYQSTLATFWGSWAFLIGSVIQWYESLDRHPVEEKKDKNDGASASSDEMATEELAGKERG